jgi:hypothetical protein
VYVVVGATLDAGQPTRKKVIISYVGFQQIPMEFLMTPAPPAMQLPG